MTVTNVLNSKSLRIARSFEVVMYAALAALFISRVFTHATSFTLQDAMLVLTGEALGIMACCMVTPLTFALAAWVKQSSPIVERVIASTGNILPFVRRNSSGNPSSSGGTNERRAA